MNQQIFVPVTDELIYNRPEEIEGPLVPYFAGMECQHWLSIEINPDESKDLKAGTSNKPSNKPSSKASKRPNLRLAYSC